MFGILSYVIAEYFNMSGVITVLVSGVCLAHYNFYNLSVGGMHATAYFLSYLELPFSRSLSSLNLSSSSTLAFQLFIIL